MEGGVGVEVIGGVDGGGELAGGVYVGVDEGCVDGGLGLGVGVLEGP